MYNILNIFQLLEQELHICNHPTKTKIFTTATLGELPCFKPCRDSYGLPFLAATRGFGSSLPAFKQNPTVTTSGDDCTFQSFHCLEYSKAYMCHNSPSVLPSKRLPIWGLPWQ